jgi:hypothetical protein
MMDALAHKLFAPLKIIEEAVNNFCLSSRKSQLERGFLFA